MGGGKIKIPSHRTSIHKSQLLQRKRCLSGQMSLFPEWTCKFMQVLHSLIYSYMLCKCLIVCCWITMAPQKDYIIHVHTHTQAQKEINNNNACIQDVREQRFSKYLRVHLNSKLDWTHKTAYKRTDTVVASAFFHSAACRGSSITEAWRTDQEVLLCPGMPSGLCGRGGGGWQTGSPTWEATSSILHPLHHTLTEELRQRQEAPPKVCEGEESQVPPAWSCKTPLKKLLH